MIFIYCFVIGSAGNFRLQPNKGQRRTLDPSVTLNLELYTPASSWRFAICQVHVKEYDVTLSLDPKFSYDSSDKGSDVAVLMLFPYFVHYNSFYLRSENKDHTFEADIIAVPYTKGGELNLHFLLSFNQLEFIYMTEFPNYKFSRKLLFVNEHCVVYEFQWHIYLCDESYARYYTEAFTPVHEPFSLGKHS